MGKRIWAMIIKQNIISIALVFAVGIIIDSFSSSYNKQGIAAGFMAIAVYIFVVVCMLVLNLVTNWIYLWMFAEKDLTGTILDDLRKAKLPAPNDYQSKNFDFLSELADDEEAEVTDRIKAAVLFGSYKTLMGRGIFVGLAMRRGIDNAILRYSQEAPKEPQKKKSSLDGLV